MARSEQIVPLSLEGTPASIGALGRWLCESDDVIATEGESLVLSTAALNLGFPRDWPAVFKQSAALRRLVNVVLKGTRCRAISHPPCGSDADIGAVHASGAQPMHSFSNAERLCVALPSWKLVKGFAVFERLDAQAGTSFVAIRHWWNMSPSGTWLDFTPVLAPACCAGKLLLIESTLGEKPEAPLRGSGQEFAIALADRLAGFEARLGQIYTSTGARAQALAQPIVHTSVSVPACTLPTQQFTSSHGAVEELASSRVVERMCNEPDMRLPPSDRTGERWEPYDRPESPDESVAAVRSALAADGSAPAADGSALVADGSALASVSPTVDTGDAEAMRDRADELFRSGRVEASATPASSRCQLRMSSASSALVAFASATPPSPPATHRVRSRSHSGGGRVSRVPGSRVCQS